MRSANHRLAHHCARKERYAAATEIAHLGYVPRMSASHLPVRRTACKGRLVGRTPTAGHAFAEMVCAKRPPALRTAPKEQPATTTASASRTSAPTTRASRGSGGRNQFTDGSLDTAGSTAAGQRRQTGGTTVAPTDGAQRVGGQERLDGTTACAPCSPAWPTWASDLPVQRRPARLASRVPVSGSGSVSGLRKAASVGGSRERARPATRDTRSAHALAPRIPLPAHPTRTRSRGPRPATRVPALRAARNFPTSSSYSNWAMLLSTRR